MSFSRMDGKLRAAAVLAFIMICADAHLASAQAGKPTAGPTVGTKPHSAAGSEEARLRQFIDKNGGYKDKRGGYYDPNAGTIRTRSAASSTIGKAIRTTTATIRRRPVIFGRPRQRRSSSRTARS